ncbi:hypothetical protein [uncultured Empedobacter sp.]|uniref:hypothetical protein n=1 Tax=uncultured Empedobacter sp. TaxID=410844 RepID=UPI0025D5954A|nr:hypothetical protein [uncultured Empedobacter sp.]
MAKEEKKVSEGQNPDGVNFDAKEMISTNAEAKTVIRYADRKTVKLLKDTTYQKKGKVYSPHKIKAEALVKQGIAEYVK